MRTTPGSTLALLALSLLAAGSLPAAEETQCFDVPEQDDLELIKMLAKLGDGKTGTICLNRSGAAAVSLNDGYLNAMPLGLSQDLGKFADGSGPIVMLIAKEEASGFSDFLQDQVESGSSDAPAQATMVDAVSETATGAGGQPDSVEEKILSGLLRRVDTVAIEDLDNGILLHCGGNVVAVVYPSGKIFAPGFGTGLPDNVKDGVTLFVGCDDRFERW